VNATGLIADRLETAGFFRAILDLTRLEEL
jgi:hypothetical protein